MYHALVNDNRNLKLEYVRVQHEVSFMPFLLNGNETKIWREKKKRRDRKRRKRKKREREEREREEEIEEGKRREKKRE